MAELAIIGGGASGLICACVAAELARANEAKLKVTIFEASDKVGRKVLASGNGRCNFSNSNIDAAQYSDPQFAGHVLEELEARFQEVWGHCEKPNCVTQYFYDHGMVYREEGEGRLYPLANKSSVVLDILRSCAHELGVTEKTNAVVRKVVPPKDAQGRFTLHMSDKVLERADYVVCAAGSSAVQEMLPECLPYIDRTPVLCALETSGTETRKMNNIRVKCEVSLVRNGHEMAKERGELMFRDYGVSGICIFNLSRFAQQDDIVSVDFLPDITEGQLKEALAKRYERLSTIYGDKLTCGKFMCGLLLPRVADVLLARLNLEENDPACLEQISKLTGILKSFRLSVCGPADVEHAQVMRGGFDPEEFLPATLEAKTVPGLHVTGEALNIDGPCGGYNLHWAFATGILAGVHCAELAGAKCTAHANGSNFAAPARPNKCDKD